MLISVIVCTHDISRLKDLSEAIESLKTQTHKNTEIVVIVDGNHALFDIIPDTINGISVLYCNDKNIGLSKSRNVGAKMAHGAVIAFFDDDAIAEPTWLSELSKMYTEHNAIAAGGLIKPLWIGKVAGFIPSEYFWLVGATHRGYANRVREVRNTFGSNLSFTRSTFLALGGFREDLGFNAGRKKSVMQGEEAELCIRMKKMFGKGVMYNPNAVVSHKVFDSRIELRRLFQRAYWQGYSKKVMAESETAGLTDEVGFLKDLTMRYIPWRIRKLLWHPTPARTTQFLFLVLFTGAIGVGYFGRMFEKLYAQAKVFLHLEPHVSVDVLTR